MSVIEMVVDEKDDRELHKVGMMVRVTKVWRKAKSEAEICIRFSCRENIIQIKLGIGFHQNQIRQKTKIANFFEIWLSLSRSSSGND